MDGIRLMADERCCRQCAPGCVFTPPIGLAGDYQIDLLSGMAVRWIFAVRACPAMSANRLAAASLSVVRCPPSAIAAESI